MDKKILEELEMLDWLIDADISIKWNNLLNISQLKRKQKSKWKKNRHKDYKGINKWKKEKILLDWAHERLLKKKMKKKH